MYGSYPNIEGGLVDEALADLLMELHIGLIWQGDDCKKMFNSGYICLWINDV
jgi:hypothetical protein